jgi:predicted NBD/HSP70 family sugar kinase
VTTYDAPVEHLHVRRHNLSLVLRLLSSHGPRSRASIAAVSGLTRATVSSLTSELIELRLVRELGPDAGQSFGRPATLLELDGTHIVTMGVELNVGYFAVLARDLGGRVVIDETRVIYDGGGSDPAGLIDQLAVQILAAVATIEAGGRHVAGLTLAMPGVVDTDRGVVRMAPNLGWSEVPLLAELTARMPPHLTIALDNEANLAALAEYRVGTLAGCQHLVYVLAENGVGGGLIVNGALMRGSSGAAGEIGHITVVPNGAPCGCGSQGCWETVVGLPALLRSALPDRAEALLADDSLDPQDKVRIIVDAARDGDSLVRAALVEYARWIGVGLANLIDVVDPEVIVLAGNFAMIAPLVMPEILASVAEHTMPQTLEHVAIEISTLGYSAAALGATIHAAERLFDEPATSIYPPQRSIS